MDSGLAASRRPGMTESYLPAVHSFVSSPISAVSGSRMAEGVREKRGAGAGWVTPWRSTKIFRAAPESILPIVVMDSGLAPLRFAPRNDAS